MFNTPILVTKKFSGAADCGSALKSNMATGFLRKSGKKRRVENLLECKALQSNQSRLLHNELGCLKIKACDSLFTLPEFSFFSVLVCCLFWGTKSVDIS